MAIWVSLWRFIFVGSSDIIIVDNFFCTYNYFIILFDYVTVVTNCLARVFLRMIFVLVRLIEIELEWELILQAISE